MGCPWVHPYTHTHICPESFPFARLFCPSLLVSAFSCFVSLAVFWRQDPDPSIRLRALDLIFQLVSRNNARALVAELLNYLVVAPSDQKRDICSKILQVKLSTVKREIYTKGYKYVESLSTYINENQEKIRKG